MGQLDGHTLFSIGGLFVTSIGAFMLFVEVLFELGGNI